MRRHPMLTAFLGSGAILAGAIAGLFGSAFLAVLLILLGTGSVFAAILPAPHDGRGRPHGAQLDERLRRRAG